MDSEYLLNDISERLSIVRNSISEACRIANRNEEDVTLVGVSKVFPVTYAEAAYKAGLEDLGENRVQELCPKIDYFNSKGYEASWHLIGTLQRNKVKYIIGKTKLIHSVNDIPLAEEINKRSLSEGICTDVLIQVNMSKEATKHGFDSEEVKSALVIMNEMENINIRGIMTMAPIETREGQARRVFEDTRNLFESLTSEIMDKSQFNILSMGMSGDYVDAIKEGSTMVRIGTSIFGDRNKIPL